MRAIREAVSLLAAAVGLFIIWNITTTFWQLTRISRVSHYENVLNHRWHRSDLIEHFPESIPETAREVKFHFNAGYLQGGAAIELRVRLPADIIEEIDRTYRPRAKSVFDAAGDPVESNAKADPLPKLSFHTVPFEIDPTSGRFTPLPEGFETLLLWSPESVNLNHPRGAGITISHQRREVIYWAQDG